MSVEIRLIGRAWCGVVMDVRPFHLRPIPFSGRVVQHQQQTFRQGQGFQDQYHQSHHVVCMIRRSLLGRRFAALRTVSSQFINHIVYTAVPNSGSPLIVFISGVRFVVAHGTSRGETVGKRVENI